MIKGKPQSFGTWLKTDAHSMRTWMENLNNGERFKELRKRNKQIMMWGTKNGPLGLVEKGLKSSTF